MKAAEKHLAYAAVENAEHQAIAEFRPAQAISVAEKETLATYFDLLRLGQHLHSHLLPE